MIPAMDEVGRRFEQGEYFVPELIISARAMKAGMAVIRPLLTARADKPAGRVALATVRGDLHDIGKNLVGTMLEGGGFEVATVALQERHHDQQRPAHAKHRPQVFMGTAVQRVELIAQGVQAGEYPIHVDTGPAGTQPAGLPNGG